MDTNTKTTVYLDAADYRRLKQIAQSEGRTAAELVREAVAEYVGRRGGVRPRTVGLGRGRKDLAEQAESLLSGFGEEK